MNTENRDLHNLHLSQSNAACSKEELYKSISALLKTGSVYS